MLVGYNHNVRYKGEIFHVQTEDSGLQAPHIITLLYRGGNIIASKKTSYADIIKMDNLNQVLEELMQEQHKEMLRRLKNEEFDVRLGFHKPATDLLVPVSVQGPASNSVAVSASQPVIAGGASSLPLADPGEAVSSGGKSLDDLIFEALSGDKDNDLNP